MFSPGYPRVLCAWRWYLITGRSLFHVLFCFLEGGESLKKVSQHRPADTQKNIAGPQPTSQSKHPKVCMMCYAQKICDMFKGNGFITKAHFRRHTYHELKVLPQSVNSHTHFRISFIDSRDRTILFSIINSTTGKYCSVASFEWSHFRISSTDSS